MSSTIPIRLAIGAACALMLATASLRADQLQMQNGDRYTGKILSVNSNSIVLESDVLGKLTLPRDKVSALTFGAGTSTNTAQALLNSLTSTAPSRKAPGAKSNSAVDPRELSANTNFVQQVRQLMRVDADPASKQKYDELVGGLMSGKLDMNDLRNEAKASIDKINELKRAQGPNADASLDTYLAILEEFVNETPASAPVNPSAPAAPAAHFGTNSTTAPREN